jgi:hypothetical protein
MKRPKLTRDQYIAIRASMKINHWIHEKGDELNKYGMGIDRVADIGLLIREAIVEIDNLIAEHEAKNENNRSSNTGDPQCHEKEADGPESGLPRDRDIRRQLGLGIHQAETRQRSSVWRVIGRSSQRGKVQ